MSIEPGAFSGENIDNALVLQSVARRSATLGPSQGAPAVQLDLPPLPLPATGSLPPAAGLIQASPAAEPATTVPMAPAPAGPARAPINRQ